MGEKRMKHKRAERKQPAAAERQVKAPGKSANTATPKPHKKETQPRVTEVTREKSIPGEGKHTTRTRNLRRRMLKKARAIDRVNENVPVIEPQSNQDPETPQMDHVHDTGVLNGIVPSSSLLKRNRNKKRGFLNQEQSKEHVRFDTPTVNTSNRPEFSGGTAIITCIDLDPDSKSERKEKKKYPVQIAPRVLTVNHSIVDSGVEDLDGNTWVDFSTHDETDNNSTTNHTTAAWESADMDEVIDFDSCEVVNFTTNLPQVLDVLAIKVSFEIASTLQMHETSATAHCIHLKLAFPFFRPWYCQQPTLQKFQIGGYVMRCDMMIDLEQCNDFSYPSQEVVVKEIDIIDGTITVEHLGLTDTALREGGRFEVDARNEGGDHSMEAEHYVDDDSIVTLLKSDIVDMRRIR